MTRWFVILTFALTLALAGQAADSIKTKNALDGAGIKKQETPLGNFVTDAMRHASGADIAIIHAMAFKEKPAISADEVVDEQAISGVLSLPTDKIAVLSLTPAVLRKVLERALSKYPVPNVAFLQISGMVVRFDPTKPAFNRVQAITVGEKALNLSDTKTTLTVAMPKGLARGAVGYILEFTEPVTRSMHVTETTLLEAVTQETAKQPGGVTAAVEHRITEITPQKTANPGADA